jgi:hypothetical protein
MAISGIAVFTRANFSRSSVLNSAPTVLCKVAGEGSI